MTPPRCGRWATSEIAPRYCSTDKVEIYRARHSSPGDTLTITARLALVALLVGLAGLAGMRLLVGPPRGAIVIGYQTGVDPTKLAQAEGWYPRAIGRPAVWRKFDSGTDVITALAASDIDFGDLGSSPLAIAATRGLPITTVVLISRLGRGEALVVRDGAGIAGPAGLIGKRVAVPFVSTSHYSLLAALRHWGIDPARVQILNLSPPQIAAAWARGDIDAAYVWDPALGKLKANGHVLTGSDEVARWGAPTFDAWVVRQDFARHNAPAVAGFVRATLAAEAAYRRGGAVWRKGSAQVAEIAAISGAQPADVPGLLASNDYPAAADQASPALLGGHFAVDLAKTAAFLHAQGKIDRVLPDYAAYVDAQWVRRAALAPGG